MKRFPLSFPLVVAMVLLCHAATAAPLVNLGTAADFAILGGSAVTFTAPTTTVTGGNVGVASGTSITGAPANLNLSVGVIHNNDAVAAAAQSASTAAYLSAQAAPATGTISNNLSGLLGPGVYKFTLGTTVNLSTTLTLDAGNVPGALFVFQVPSDLVTASGSAVNLINGADACNIIWQVTSSATLGSASTFDGTVLALTSITLADGVTVNGRLLAQTGLVSLIHDTVTTNNCQPGDTTGGLPASVPESGSAVLLLAFALVSLIVFKRSLRSGQFTHPVAPELAW